jgi:ABC-type transport system involved in multi-copper enzyme maturation permease subunit
MHRQILTIARFTMLEALRTRLPWLVGSMLGFIWAGSLFVQQIAITESARMQWSFFASGARLASVFMLTLYITSSMVREFNEKGLELVLALDLPRSSYLLGKLAGFIAIAAALAVIAAAPLTLSTPAQVSAVWATSLFFELVIVCAASLFCIVTFSQVMPAVIIVAAFYTLARTITAMRLMADTDLLGSLGGARPAVDFGVEALAYLLPALDRFAMTEWVAARAVDADVLGPIALSSAIYVGLLLGASLFDFYRREL